MGKLGGEGYASLYLASIMMGLCWIVVSARVFVRYWKNLIGLDDILMVVGLVGTPRLPRRDTTRVTLTSPGRSSIP